MIAISRLSRFCLVLIFTIFSLVGLITIGVEPIRSAFFIICFGSQTILGMAFWVKANRNRNPSFAELVAIGIPIGMIVSTFLAQITLGIGLGVQGFVLTSAIGLFVSLKSEFKTKIIFRECNSKNARDFAKFISYGFLISLPAFLSYIHNNPKVTNGIIRYQIDIPYLASISHSVVNWGGNVNPVFSGTPLRYHWLSFGWVGWVSKILNLGELTVLTRILPVIGIFTLLTSTVALTRTITDNKFAPTLALTLMIFGIPVGAANNFGSSLHLSSLSQFVSNSWVLAGFLAYLCYIKKQTDSLFTLICFAIICAGIAGSKFTSSLIFGSGMLGVIFVLIYQRYSIRKSLNAFIIYLISTGIIYFSMISGANNFKGSELIFGPGLGIMTNVSTWQIMGYDLEKRILFWCVVGVSGGISLLLKVSGMFSLLGLQRRLRIEEAFVIASMTAGILMTAVTSQLGHSQLYFALTALTITTPVAIWVLLEIRELIEFPKTYYEPVLIVIGVIISILVFYSNLESQSLSSDLGINIVVFHVLGPVVILLFVLSVIIILLVLQGKHDFISKSIIIYSVALVLTMTSIFTGGLNQVKEGFSEATISPSLVSYELGGGWTSAHENAMTWLKSETGPDDIVATNRFCPLGEPVNSCFASSYVVSSLSGRQVLVEGHYWYATSLKDIKPPWVMARIKASVSFSENPSKTTWGSLRSYGVTWLVVDKKFPKAKNWEPYGVIKFENSHILLIHLVSSLGNGEFS